MSRQSRRQFRVALMVGVLGLLLSFGGFLMTRQGVTSDEFATGLDEMGDRWEEGYVELLNRIEDGYIVDEDGSEFDAQSGDNDGAQVSPSTDAGIKVNMYSSPAGQGDWSVDNTVADPGDLIDYMIRFENTGDSTLENVAVGVHLADYQKYVAGSGIVYNSNNPDGLSLGTDNVYTGGVDVGNYSADSAGYVRFTTRIDPVQVFEQAGEHTLTSVGIVRPQGMNDHFNVATIEVGV